MDQPALAGTSSETLEDIVGAKFYCPQQPARPDYGEDAGVLLNRVIQTVYVP